MMTKRLVALLVVLVCLVPAWTVSTTASAKIIAGDTPANIRAVQTRLQTLGYYTARVDGIWGSQTDRAVRAFQRDRKLVVDGIVGARTVAALGITLGAAAPSASNISQSDLNLLARCVFAEARGEPYTGQVAIAAVVLNRVRNNQFPSSIAGVIYQPLAFTAVADGQINLSPNQTAFNAARDALNGWDPTGGCLYYYNPATATSKWIWGLTVSIRIGRHNFARG